MGTALKAKRCSQNIWNGNYSLSQKTVPRTSKMETILKAKNVPRTSEMGTSLTAKSSFHFGNLRLFPLRVDSIGRQAKSGKVASPESVLNHLKSAFDPFFRWLGYECYPRCIWCRI